MFPFHSEELVTSAFLMPWIFEVAGACRQYFENLMSEFYRAVVVERSRASYLIDVLGMPKVEGSNPGLAVLFS